MQDVLVYVVAASVSGAFLLNEVKDLKPMPKKQESVPEAPKNDSASK